MVANVWKRKSLIFQLSKKKYQAPSQPQSKSAKFLKKLVPLYVAQTFEN